MKRIILCFICIVLLAGCGRGPRIEPIGSLTPTRTPRPTEEEQPTPTPLPIPKQRVEEDGSTVLTRFNPSLGFTRQATEPGTFSAYLQSLPLMAAGSQVVAYDDTVREKDDYDAVLGMAVLGKNEQGAGAIAHLRAQYFFSKQDFDKITFLLNDGFNFTFGKWRQGNKLKFVDGRAAWTTGGTASDNEENFHSYLTTYFLYSGMKSLKKDLNEVDVTDPVRIGDVFITSGETPRAIIVVDCATDENGSRQVILMEGGKPAQPLRVLKNPLDSTLSPWFTVDTTNGLITIDSDGTQLQLEPYGSGNPARFKFLTDATTN